MSPERDCIQGGLTPSGEGLARGQRPDRFDTEELPKCSTRHDLVNLWETGWAGLGRFAPPPGHQDSLCSLFVLPGKVVERAELTDLYRMRES